MDEAAAPNQVELQKFCFAVVQRAFVDIIAGIDQYIRVYCDGMHGLVVTIAFLLFWQHVLNDCCRLKSRADRFSPRNHEASSQYMGTACS